MNLFVIGNGFDLSHGLSTSYEDFHKYLKMNYPTANADAYLFPEPFLMPDGSIYYDDDLTVGFLIRLITNVEPYRDKWSDLESSLGILSFDSFFDIYGDFDYHFEKKGLRNYENSANNLIIPTTKIKDYFSDWINTIVIDQKLKIKNDFKKIINGNADLFLSFIYTKTLEILYNVKTVCHIHGEQGNSNIIFGHGNSPAYYDKNRSEYIGSEIALQEIQDMLRKNTFGAIKSNQLFFERLSPSIGKIYSFGFSFSTVDEIYKRDLFQNSNK